MTDREIIEAIATKVMGWVRNERESCWVDPSCKNVYHYGSCCGGRITECGDYYCSDPHCAWNPIEDANAAKQVREKLAEMGWQMTLVHKPFDKFEQWVFHGVRLEDPVKGKIARVSIHGTDEFRAVCLCALKTVGIDAKAAPAPSGDEDGAVGPESLSGSDKR